MPAPLLVFEPTQTHAAGTTTAVALLTLNPSLANQGFWTSAIPAGFSNSVQILASGATPGVLAPGESEQVPVYYDGWQQPWDFDDPPFNIQLGTVKANDPTPIDWSSLASSPPPATLSPTAWSVMTTNFIAQVGGTAGSFVSRLDADASYLASLGEKVNDVSELVGFEMQQAAGLTLMPQLETTSDASITAPGVTIDLTRSFESTVVGRNQLGPFGYGWTIADWEQTASVAADGTVTVIDPSGAQDIFQPDSRNPSHYFSQPGDYETLQPDGAGGFVMTDPNGTVTDFNAGGQIALCAGHQRQPHHCRIHGRSLDKLDSFGPANRSS